MASNDKQADQVQDKVLKEAKSKDTLYKVLLLLVSAATIALLAHTTFRHGYQSEWRSYRQGYKKILEEKATDDWGRKLADDFKIEMEQIVVPELGVTDRCITCHAGTGDRRMIGKLNPYRAHPGDHLDIHEPDKFGCTVCHEGQGRAVTSADAHGAVKHWFKPRYFGSKAFSTCSKCHYENDLYGANEDLFTKQVHAEPISSAELDGVIPGFKGEGSRLIIRGKNLTLKLGCLGCHTYRSRGGTLGPDISYVGDKEVHDFDFTHKNGTHTVSSWLYNHFKHPAEVSPNTLMPQYDLEERGYRGLANYMLSQHYKKMPASYTPAPAKMEAEPATGEELFRMFCSACHGGNGKGSTVREYGRFRSADPPIELMVPSLNNTDTLSVASDDYIRHIISNGRQGTTMIGWSEDKEGGLLDDEVDRIVGFIRSWQDQGPELHSIAADRGDERIGGIIYQRNCASCHGSKGQGGIGTSLNSPAFLAIASDQFLARTLISGRANTAMPSWTDLDSQQMSDVIAFLRSWHPVRSDEGTVLKLLGAGKNKKVSADIGKILYKANCVMCHGKSGEGDLAPSISTQEFLTLVDDSYLYETIAAGRSGTGMPAWKHFSSEDIASLIMLIDSWRSSDRKEMSTVPVQGDWDSGRFIYEGSCTGCHGAKAEGATGPQLANHQFLQSVTDGVLREWISYGKTGTAMRGFLKGQAGMTDMSVNQINNVISYLRMLDRQDGLGVAKYFSGRPDLGQMWYEVFCASCHGVNGEGASGPSLANKDFLSAASSGYLMATLAMGRDGTEMRPVMESPQSILSLSSDHVNDLVAYLRYLENVEQPIPHNFVIPWDIEHGRELYVSNCAGCHGINGKADTETEPGRLSAWAPELNNQSFLTAATDGFLQATIAKGRIGTSMRAFGQGSQGLVDMSSDDIDDIVAYMRQWSRHQNVPMTIPAEQDKALQLEEQHKIRVRLRRENKI